VSTAQDSTTSLSGDFQASHSEVEMDKYRINKTFHGTLALNAGESVKLKGQSSIGNGAYEFF